MIDKKVRQPYNICMRYGKDDKSLAYAVLNLTHEYLRQEKEARCYGTDVSIFYSEIHVLMQIVDHPGIHINGLAEELNVTKASASEIVKKLERKGLVEKKVDEQKLSKLAVYVTDKGKLAHENHMKYHDRFEQMIEKHVSSGTEGEIAFLLKFLHNVAKDLDRVNEVTIQQEKQNE
ncbi:MAG: MarR family winged helix-turn-helix transcriptional regulator [Firmicutes bacterium]|nr:MarR family winged helix-turn-helix transcriptional regulator [Bacillota bacterium]